MGTLKKDRTLLRDERKMEKLKAKLHTDDDCELNLLNCGVNLSLDDTAVGCFAHLNPLLWNFFHPSMKLRFISFRCLALEFFSHQPHCCFLWYLLPVNWLDHSRTFREQGVDENETLLLRRKFFYSDQNVDSRDPVQLNLLYVQVWPRGLSIGGGGRRASLQFCLSPRAQSENAEADGMLFSSFLAGTRWHLKWFPSCIFW